MKTENVKLSPFYYYFDQILLSGIYIAQVLFPLSNGYCSVGISELFLLLSGIVRLLCGYCKVDQLNILSIYKENFNQTHLSIF